MENGNDHYCAYATNNNNHPKQHDLNELLLIDDSIDDYGNDNGDHHRQLVKNGGGGDCGGPRSCMKPYARQRSRNRLKAVAFTSEVYQTLFEDETTVALPVCTAAPAPSVACNGSGAANGHETHTSLKISRETTPGNDEDAASLPVVTGNWGCGRRYRGEHQLKLFVQWMSASMAGVPRLIYYTRGREELASLEHIERTLTERRCTVGDLVAEARRYAESVLREAQQSVHGDPDEARLDEVHSSSRLISSLFEGTIENARHRF
ncbi:unnamed protein product [Trichogramma brassicae]|uniref:PARG catalytic Macro domain-containing protein n=1 Tax=Trichogramma brassicae TaxID=86971 RepID=A0A6H5IUD5_9HYME|nr:unnamed protein product [Trichogramma brassicae]